VRVRMCVYVRAYTHAYMRTRVLCTCACVCVCDLCVSVRESAGKSPRRLVLIIRVSLKPLDDHTSERVILQKLLRGQQRVGLGRLLTFLQPVADCWSVICVPIHCYYRILCACVCVCVWMGGCVWVCVRLCVCE